MSKQWRIERRRRGVLRTEHTREALPAEVQALLLDMADRIVKLERARHDLEQRIDPLERANRLLAEEAAKRVGAAA